MLQWSHVFSDMVRAAGGVGTGLDAVASMEPCLFRHGKRAKRLCNDCSGGASMEPCLFRHGKVVVLFLDKCTKFRLQWSHVFSDMVSVSPGEERRLSCRGFNGAMSFQTW